MLIHVPKMASKSLLHILLIINCLAVVKSFVFDACVSHHVNITSKPVIITSSHGEDNSREGQDNLSGCTLTLYVEEGNALSVAILNSSLSDTYSYMYFEDMNSSNSQCLKSYISTSLNSTPCNTLITYTTCKLHIRNTLVTITVKGVSVAVPRCLKSGDLSLPWLTLSDDNISPLPVCETSTYDYKIIHPGSRYYIIAIGSGEKNALENVYVT